MSCACTPYDAAFCDMDSHTSANLRITVSSASIHFCCGGRVWI